MADLYNTVKKQGEQLDGLQKKVTDNTERIATLETRSQATPPAQSAAAPEITVAVPDNIATVENIEGLLDKALVRNTQIVSEAAVRIMEEAPKPTIVAPKYDDEVLKTVARQAADQALERRYSKLEYAAEKLNNRVNGIVNGVIWGSLPVWFYALFIGAVLAAIGFGYGFFSQMAENNRLRQIEWLYREQRILYSTEDAQKILVNRERDFLRGTTAEQDSIKDFVRYWEDKRGLDDTFLYFAPTEE